jgi:hypothetical protein
MEKRKNPPEPTDPADQDSQIPDVGPALPELTLPIDEVAATVPKLPENGSSPLSPPAKAKPKFTPPAKARDFDPTQHQKVRRGQLENVMVLYPPAHARFSTIATSLLGDCAIANGLGNREPAKVFVSFNEEGTLCFLMPVGPKASKGVDVSYTAQRAVISLWASFEEMGKVVRDGFRQIYALERTEEPVTIHETTGYALYFSLEEYDVEEIGTREATPAGATTDRPKRRAKKSETANPEPASAKIETSTEPADPAEPEDELSALERAQESMLEARDDKIYELEQRLKAYEKRFGKV